MTVVEMYVQPCSTVALVATQKSPSKVEKHPESRTEKQQSQQWLSIGRVNVLQRPQRLNSQS